MHNFRQKTAGTSIMSKIPEISIGSQMEWSVSVPPDRNIRDHLWRWSTYFGRTGPTEICLSVVDKPVHCPAQSLHLRREFGKGIKNGKSPIPLGWPGLINFDKFFDLMFGV